LWLVKYAGKKKGGEPDTLFLAFFLRTSGQGTTVASILIEFYSKIFDETNLAFTCVNDDSMRDKTRIGKRLIRSL
jgi:hypothetical protein